MKESTQTRGQISWRSIGILVPVALLFLIAVIVLRHRIVVTTPQAVTLPASNAGPLPALASIKRNPGSATLSLDVVIIDGKKTVVAGSTSPRTFRITRNDTVAFRGWAFDPAAAAPAGGLIVQFGAKPLPAAYGLARPDVAAAYKVPNLTLVGFNGLVAGRSLHAGANPISFAVISRDLKSYYVNPSVVVLVRN